jgi:response regulator RpfG family c-di-GMP phosphodiesterase
VAATKPARAAVTVVDDEPYALDVLIRAARSWDFDCQAAASAEEAIAMLEKNPTPVVVTDLRMPGLGGVWLVREIQKRWPDVSIIVITAGQELDALAQCLDAGAHHYFLKPINFDEFHHALQATLRTHGVQRERRLLERTVARQTAKVRRTFLSAIDSLVRTLEARDPTTSGHSLRVRDYVVRVAVRLGLDERARRRLSVASKLHDIGKVGLPEGILNKPGKLTRAEYAQVKEHPAVSERILTPIIRSQEVLAAIRGHHERYDGLGYPDGLRGEDIPILARILSIADCFDALTSNRAYRAALPRAEALAILTEARGSQFDPFLVPHFAAMIRDEM